MIGVIVRNAMIGLLLAAMTLPAHAQLVSTGDALALETGQLEQRVEAFLLRDDVAAELAQYGISHERAMARVDNMSAAELEQLSGRIDDVIRVSRVRWIKIKECSVFNQNVLLGHAIRANTEATTNQESGHTC